MYVEVEAIEAVQGTPDVIIVKCALSLWACGWAGGVGYSIYSSTVI